MPLPKISPVDPVWYDSAGMHGGWYFYDETWADQYGPFETEEKAREELDKYMKFILSKNDNRP